MQPSPRGVALDVLNAVEERKAYANLQLTHALEGSGLHRLDRGLVSELVLGVLRRQNALDFALDGLLKRPGDVHPVARRLLRLGAYQILYLDRIPDAAACHETVELAKQAGLGRLTSLINGVLRQLVRRRDEIPWPRWEDKPVAHLTVVESHPEWLVRRWLKQFGAERTRAICQANNRPAAVSLRVNRLRVSRDAFLQRLADAGVEAFPSALHGMGVRLASASAVTRLPGFAEGLFTVQDESSMVVAPVVDPQPGEIVLDACAAPGGKTTHMAEWSGDKATIYSWDIHPHKLGLIRENCRRLGIERVQVEAIDARQPAEALRGGVDRLLLDAPCSGLGVLRRKPELRYRIFEADLVRLRELQRELLDGVAPLVKPGGVLVYSTCTIEPEENFQQVKDFLQRHPDFGADDLSPFLPELDFTEEEKRQSAKGYFQILPHRFQTDGFFVARLRRRS
ncbi:ribosomal RNA small subunit methyltransferase b [Heliomicrobium modesticaldum Ice1]|uniref:16S rRNA (cytosine(967)-C(5))-methyltransferase n=1 Tax=Heliobacterium modesticaldum (strain ATCC 51547 / Ice1) TaxID=498761 RepID=A0A173G7H7_HELMI|nr:16S rRNA (cytosine(967)-C(5))-methyltransferase RsmB [Heliomicrobium modesticaldum]ANH22097.1 ribosomal RNA small subunit methyltransferase b [Heliomicrobium modesticaldum Ice1]